ncbi:MAG: hypothetical protein B9S36_00710 [Verrucomicrobiia bacterium Tous-C2TDCM]|nr:MAG: hypothetical protein B9S36_00710 [Verrucomicrobiae bacterium Tous-C2TDCM]
MKSTKESIRSKSFLFSWFQTLAALAAACVLCSCLDKEKEEELAKVVQEKKDLFEGLKRDLVEKNDELRRVSNEISELENATRNLRQYQKQELEVTKEFNDLKKYIEEVKASTELLEGSLTSWRRVARESFRGLQVGSLDLGGGRVVADATVLEMSDGSVLFSHQGGQTQVKLAELPNPLRERLIDESLVIQSIRIDPSQK